MNGLCPYVLRIIDPCMALGMRSSGGKTRASIPLRMRFDFGGIQNMEEMSANLKWCLCDAITFLRMRQRSEETEIS
jgi:hypothetical protein